MEIGWALEDAVRLTLIEQDADLIKTVILVESIDRQAALVLTFADCVVLVNGVRRDLGDALPQWCGLADELVCGPIRNPGDNVTVEASEI